MKIPLAALLVSLVFARVDRSAPDVSVGAAAMPREQDPAVTARPGVLRPRALRRGDTIMFVAPAGPVDRERMAEARKVLEKRGYKVVERPDIYDRWGYLAGSDERRVAELVQAFTDPKVDAIVCGGGGYGVTRILDRIDFDVIRQNPKIFVGFSDITGLHVAIGQRTGLITFHGPVAESSLGSRNGMSEFTAASFYSTLEVGRGDRAGAGDEEYVIEVPSSVAEVGSLGRGKASGRLVGGNLSLVAAMMGTPDEIETRGAVLFLEDVGESAYRIDRMLTTLRLAGKLDGLAAAVLGQFTRSDRREPARSGDPEFTTEAVLERFFAPLGIPVLTGFPAGHHAQNATLPMGALVEVDAQRKRLRVVERLFEPSDDKGRSR